MFVFFFLQIFWKISFSLQKAEYFWRTKNEKKKKQLDQVLTQKWLCLDQVLTLQHKIMPLGQSAAYILALLQKRNSVFALVGEMQKIWGEQNMQKLHQILVHFWGPFLL